METSVTNSIRISVEPFYLEQESAPALHRYVYAYRITIENMGMETVQLLRRHWYILESSGSIREVEGEGVVGQQPVLPPGEVFRYTSWCPMLTDIGKMHGTFQMKRHSDNALFEVKVPEFKLFPPFKAN